MRATPAHLAKLLEGTDANSSVFEAEIFTMIRDKTEI